MRAMICQCLLPVLSRGGGIRIVPIFLIMMALTLVLPRLQAQEPAGGTEAMDLMLPGEEHKLLESLAGPWEQEISFWVRPDQEPMTFSGTADSTMILGGRFLKSDAVTETGPMQTRALTIMGFDRRFNKYTMVGFDTMGTYYVTAEGVFDKETRTFHLHGENKDVDFSQKYRFDIRLEGEDRMVAEIIFFDMPGLPKEHKMVEIVSTRKK